MKAIFLISALMSLASPVHAEKSTVWFGTCRNVTAGEDGFVKIFMTENAGTTTGYISITGFLGGSATLQGSELNGTSSFTSGSAKNGMTIQWTGRHHLEGIPESMSGEYRCKPGDQGVVSQVGEFSVQKVAEWKGREFKTPEDFTAVYTMVLETNLNSAKRLADGSRWYFPEASFNRFHPAGKGLNVRVTKVDLDWSPGSDRKSMADLQRASATYTLYWTGLITPRGTTDAVTTYNYNLGQFTKNELISTTGVTNEKATQAAVDVGFEAGILLGKFLFDDGQ